MRSGNVRFRITRAVMVVKFSIEMTDTMGNTGSTQTKAKNMGQSNPIVQHIQLICFAMIKINMDSIMPAYALVVNFLNFLVQKNMVMLLSHNK